jgi:hypothetical protein
MNRLLSVEIREINVFYLFIYLFYYRISFGSWLLGNTKSKEGIISSSSSALTMVVGDVNVVVVYTANNLPFMYSQQRFSQASLLIPTKCFQNIIMMFCLEL